MLLIAKFLSKIITILNSEVSPRQIAAGFALGAWIGLLPLHGLMPYVLLLLSFLVNVNLAILFLASAIFKLLAFAIDPIANRVGYFFLTKVPVLHPLWTKLYNMPVVPYTRFNNTIVMGSLIIGFVLLIPFYFLARIGIVQYRTSLKEKILRWKILKIIQASSLYKWYVSLRGMAGQ